jgi:drug/metabolite transporter (DMT)-like permease
MVTDCTPPPESTIVVGVILAIVGNLLISVSFQITKLAHNKNQNSQVSYLKLPLWWVSVVTMAGGEVGNFLAYGYAPATIVSPLGAVSVIFNAILSKFFLQEANSWAQYLGVVFALAGSVGVVLGAPYSCEVEVTAGSLLVLLQQPTSVAFFAFVLCVTLSLAIFGKESWMEQHVLGYTLICGLLGAITVMSSKGVSTGFRDAFAGNPEWFRSWLVYILILAMLGSIFFQMKYLNRAMMTFGSSQVCRVSSSSHPSPSPASPHLFPRLCQCISSYLSCRLSPPA